MSSNHALHVFDEHEKTKLHNLLALQIARMMGRKMEEDDWTRAYCAAKGFPNGGWSNLDIDVTAGNLGIEHKMLRVKNGDITDACGTSLMHPSLTRSIRIDDVNLPADEVKNSVLIQYGELLEARRKKISEQNQTGLPVELRTGWLLWQESLRQFLYFEELATAPDPDDFVAHWNERSAAGSRKPSKNLWIFDKNTNSKRYSVTTSAGIKIQPYFSVPSSLDPNLYVFTVIGERISMHGDSHEARMWLTPETAKALSNIAGSLDAASVQSLIERAFETALMIEKQTLETSTLEAAIPVIVPVDVYEKLIKAFPGTNDDHSIALMLAHLELIDA